MDHLKLEINKNFILIDDNWGEVVPSDLVALFDSVIVHFYLTLNVDRIYNKIVFIRNDGLKKTPMIIKGINYDTIYLNVKNRLRDQYSYQFVHELCHYVINNEYPPKNDKFGWLEETLCELASIYTLLKMSISWETNPPYVNWKEYSPSLKSYAENIINNPDYILDENFNLWFNKKISYLYKNRYERMENSIIAIKLLPIFLENNNLWKSIQYINEITVFDEMELKDFLKEWKKKIPTNLIESFEILENNLLS